MFLLYIVYNKRGGCKMTEYRCMICGRVGSVGRCCSTELREPLNNEAVEEQSILLASRKSYNDLSEDQKSVIDEYMSWRRLGDNGHRLETFMLRADNLEIEHLL
jgi:hypothetical protein